MIFDKSIIEMLRCRHILSRGLAELDIDIYGAAAARGIQLVAQGRRC